jgi:hypothetical protein
MWTARGERRAGIGPCLLETLWLNAGTFCNIACASCHIEGSPRNGRLAYTISALSLAQRLPRPTSP